MGEHQDLKAIARNFLQFAAAGGTQLDEAFEKFVADGFRHHNPFFKGDAESLRAGMKENHLQFPQKTLRIERDVQEGDLVVLHSRVKMSPEHPVVAVVHIFRFENGKIVELWDLGQAQPENMLNEHGMF
jgi:predicted SnoaL-like aldol condensation-catalyzing enzyme